MTAKPAIKTESYQDIRFMRLALSLAQRGLGTTAPNPSVGCVIVRDHIIMGRGTTASGGRPHAETVALAQAGSAAKGATAYVTLEPCCHVGKTRPCTDALIEAGIARVVIAVQDENPQVAGGGIEALRQAGIEVLTGVLAEEAEKINAGFFSVHRKKRPLVTLKLATTLDGKIATAHGESQWITCPEARQYAHLLRAQHDAVMVGAGTVLADDPELTCRLPGLEARKPIRMVMDTKGTLPLQAKIMQGKVPSWVISTEKKPYPSHIKQFLVAKDTSGNVDVTAALETLAAEGITRVLVEGGAALATALWQAGCIDRLVWIRAPKVLGNDSKAALHALELKQLQDAKTWQREAMFNLGVDCCEIFIKKT